MSNRLVAVVAVLAFLPFLVQYLPSRTWLITKLESSEGAAAQGTWKAHAVYADDEPPPRAKGLETWGSYVGGDQFTGEFLSGWYKPTSHCSVFVAGYPCLPGNVLEIEARCRGGAIATVRYAESECKGHWIKWSLPLPEGTESFRIRGVDGRTGFQGWLGVSAPFDDPLESTFSWKMVAMTIGTVALALLVVIGPGVVWCGVRNCSWANVLWVGPLGLLAGSLLCWILGGTVDVAALGAGWTASTLVLTVSLAWRYRVWTKWTVVERLSLCLIGLMVLGAAGKAAFSGGQAGELFRGSISRSLEVGGHSDSRISFHTVQVVANHLTPYGEAASRYYSPWNFSSRGPIAGLVCAPVVLATGSRPPLGMPDQLWLPFDPEGFAAYRITMMVLAALALVAVPCLLRKLGDEKFALTGLVLTALTPFMWHEMYFSWPKMLAAAWVFGAFILSLEQRPFWTGLALGAAYLAHPLALLSMPLVGGWWLLRKQTPWPKRLQMAVCYGTAVVLVLIAWRLANGTHFNQTGFLRYFLQADSTHPCTIKQWLVSRWNNCADTLVPLYVWIVNKDHPSYSSWSIHSDRLVQFFLQYWVAWPFAAGLVAWLGTIRMFGKGISAHLREAAFFLFVPFVFLVVFWGGAVTGLMRESGHVLFLSYLVFLVWSGGGGPLCNLCAKLCILSILEVWALMFVPALCDFYHHPDGLWLLNDIFWIFVSTVCLAIVGTIARRLMVDLAVE